MLIFSEACSRVMMRRVESEDPGLVADMEEAAEKFREMHTEIQNSFEAEVLARFLLEAGQENGWPLIAVICIALSHGVMLGIEMEKQEIE